MSFDITNCVQTKLWFESQNTKIYESLKDRPKLARIGALGLGMSQALITLVAKVTNIGEVVIKGLANIFGAPFHGKCSALRGLKLLGLTLPIEILSSIFTVGLALKQLLIDPALAFKNPKEFIEQQIQMHQKTEEVCNYSRP